MATSVRDPEPPHEFALRVLLVAAAELPIPACEELIRRLRDLVIRRSHNFDHDLTPRADRDRRIIGAIRSVAEVVGHAPQTSEYIAEYERRKALGDDSLPSISSILKRFGRWVHALAAAGLTPEAAQSAFARRRSTPKWRPARYRKERLHDCLRACARDLGRTPSVRDYTTWREDILAGAPGRRLPGEHIPHYRTFEDR